MKLERAKLYWKEAQSLATQKAFEQGSKHIVTGGLIEATRALWERDKEKENLPPFENFWPEVRKAGFAPKLSKTKPVGPTTLRDMYFQMANTHKFLPADDVLVIAWKCGENTISKIRSELKLENGAVFEKIESGYKVVTPPKKAEVRPIPKTAPAPLIDLPNRDDQLPLEPPPAVSEIHGPFVLASLPVLDKELLELLATIGKSLEKQEVWLERIVDRLSRITVYQGALLEVWAPNFRKPKPPIETE